MRTLTVQQYYELVQADGLLHKSAQMGTILFKDVSPALQIKSLDDEEEEDDDETREEEDDDDAPSGKEEGEEEDIETKGNRTNLEFDLTICTDDADRVNDVLETKGCVTKDFARNPLFLWEHGRDRKLHESVLGKIKSLKLEDHDIKAKAIYMPLTSNPLVAQIMEMEHKGLIPGNSIGWRPLGDITLHRGVRRVGKWELIEVSKVLIPANGRAVNKRVG